MLFSPARRGDEPLGAGFMTGRRSDVWRSKLKIIISSKSSAGNWWKLGSRFVSSKRREGGDDSFGEACGFGISFTPVP
jgi:hypothetical protein